MRQGPESTTKAWDSANLKRATAVRREKLRLSMASHSVKLYTQNVLTHGRFCCGRSSFERAKIAKLLPHAVARLALPLDGR